MSATEALWVVVLVGQVSKGQEEPWRKDKVGPRGHGWTNKHQLIHKQTSRPLSRATVSDSAAAAEHSATAPLTTTDAQHETEMRRSSWERDGSQVGNAIQKGAPGEVETSLSWKKC